MSKKILEILRLDILESCENSGDTKRLGRLSFEKHYANTFEVLDQELSRLYELEKKNTPMEKINVNKVYDYFWHTESTCPKCDGEMYDSENYGYCPFCGQALKSGDNKPLQNESGE